MRQQQENTLFRCVDMHGVHINCSTMGNAARKQAEKLYSREQIYQTLEEIYQKAFEHNKQRN